MAAAALILAITMAATRRLVETRNGVAPKGHARLRHVPGVLLALCAIGFCIFLSEGAIADWTAVYLKQMLGAGEGPGAGGLCGLLGGDGGLPADGGRDHAAAGTRARDPLRRQRWRRRA